MRSGRTTGLGWGGKGDKSFQGDVGRVPTVSGQLLSPNRVYTPSPLNRFQYSFGPSSVRRWVQGEEGVEGEETLYDSKEV